MKVACLDLPALPLQLAWRKEPELRRETVVVIDEDRPQGTVLWACERARAASVLPGQRYAHALSLHRGLRARVVPPESIEAAITEIRTVLHACSPHVEAGEPGTFWLDGEGLDRIFIGPEMERGGLSPTLGTEWGKAIQRAIVALGLSGAIVIGFSRFATFALARARSADEQTSFGARARSADEQTSFGARARSADEQTSFGARARSADEQTSFGARARSADEQTSFGARATRSGITVLRSDADERAAAAAVSLARLDLDPKLRDSLARLGVTTLGQMVRLPGGGILERFGREAHRLYQLAAGERWDPIVPVPPPEAPDERIVLDDDLEDTEQLVFVLRPAIDRLIARLAARARAITALHIELVLRHAVGDTELRAECIKPAAATLDGRSLIRLVHLRCTGTPPSAPVHAARVWADDVAATHEQLAMFASRPRRDLRAANEALARVRAELGDDAVVHAVLREGHLPEASFGWERLLGVVPASPRPRLVRPLVRRLHTRPQQLPPQARQVRDDGWLLSGLEHGAVVRILGPYVVSGGWWARELHREYHFAELRRGDCLWVYYDRNRRRWFCHGAVE